MSAFAKLDLRGAHLTSIGLDWESGELTIEACILVDGIAESATRCQLVWTRLRRLTVPRLLRAGNSTEILSGELTKPGRYEITMRTGDVLIVEAGNFEVVRH